MKETVFLDDENNIVTSDKATKAVIRETDELGNMIKETFGEIKKPDKRNTDIIEIYEPTPEMQKVLDEFDKKSE